MHTNTYILSYGIFCFFRCIENRISLLRRFIFYYVRIYVLLRRIRMHGFLLLRSARLQLARSNQTFTLLGFDCLFWPFDRDRFVVRYIHLLHCTLVLLLYVVFCLRLRLNNAIPPIVLTTLKCGDSNCASDN